MRRLNAIKDWTRQKWDALVERLHHSRIEARILVRLDELEACILAEIHAVSGPKETIPISMPKVSIPLNSISIPIGDGQRVVEFQGIELSQRFYAEDLKRITETLYGISSGQYLVHVKTLHRGKGLLTEYALHEIDEGDLGENGQYAALGWSRLPMTMEEALR